MTQDNGARAELPERIDLALVPYRDPDGGIHVDDPADMPHFIERLSRAFLPDAAELDRLRGFVQDVIDWADVPEDLRRHARAALASERSAGTLRDDARLRAVLWAGHGHGPALYGDDGELQCHWCGLDYKRAPMSEVMDTALNPPSLVRAAEGSARDGG